MAAAPRCRTCPPYSIPPISIKKAQERTHLRPRLLARRSSARAEKDFDVHLGFEGYPDDISRLAVDPDFRLFEVEVWEPAREEAAKAEIVPIRKVGMKHASLVVGVCGLEAHTLHAIDFGRLEAEV